MAQGVLPYKYEEERNHAGMTALAGLPIYLDLASVLGVSDCIRAHIHVRESGQGWTDEQSVLSLMLLNLAGGDCVDDIKILEKDEGFCKVLGRVETKGLRRKQRRAMERRWRKEHHRSVPSPSALFRYLEAFHDPEAERKRAQTLWLNLTNLSGYILCGEPISQIIGMSPKAIMRHGGLLGGPMRRVFSWHI
ncbi:MAG: hypothetical protein A2169_07530 [Deltaproteobacteria bacterium RBG_13_47_9]|nr:MAG: hypothetical protein A2169_07530 [Deltaproteobacteria bacterium RBG_13_47_9]